MPNRSIFTLDNEQAYQTWREKKLAGYPQTLSDLIVEVQNPFELSDQERTALLAICAKTNMVIYAVKQPELITENPLPALLRQLGVTEIDRNLGADTGGLSKLSPGGAAQATFADYIPYRQAQIGWHTDGYYNTANNQVQTLALYCERSAHEGGENALIDHEIAYIHLRDQNPDFIRALMDPEVMTIPARMEGERVARPDRTGPVFSVDPDHGHLHMRYTARTISIRWKDSDLVREALAALTHFLNHPSPYLFEGRLEAGLGLISNNVLHTRGAFKDLDGGPKRVLYRLRCHDRVGVKI
ncbi:MAG: TauD/TfdA family dioxygenase [Magnetococcales bacterium]|nr:TauD/TfdA family dioxygenase [Magnetococcales bacterium]